MSIHLTKNGKPDMRYKSSREFYKTQEREVPSILSDKSLPSDNDTFVNYQYFQKENEAPTNSKKTFANNNTHIDFLNDSNDPVNSQTSSSSGTLPKNISKRSPNNQTKPKTPKSFLSNCFSDDIIYSSSSSSSSPSPNSKKTSTDSNTNNIFSNDRDDLFVNSQAFLQDSSDSFPNNKEASSSSGTLPKNISERSSNNQTKSKTPKPFLSNCFSDDIIHSSSPSSSSLSSPSPKTRNYTRHSSNSVIENKILYNSSNLRLKQDGTIDRSSKAVKSGDIKFNSDGTVDRECVAVRSGYLFLDSRGNPDITIHTDLKIPKNPGKYKTTVYRDPYQQRKFRKESNCPKDHDASHIVDLELARDILKSKPGRHPTESDLRQSMKPLNKLLEARPSNINRANPSNPDNDRAMARRIMKIIHGENIIRSRALDDKILQMKRALHSIPQEELNAQIRYVMKEIDRISPAEAE